MRAILLSCICIVHTGSAASYTAASVALSDVTNAYNLCSNGDTLIVPAGTATWATPFVMAKNLTVLGAGSNSTIITCSANGMNVGSSSAGNLRISGFKLIGGPTNVYGIYLKCVPNCRPRIDRCHFENFEFSLYSYAAGVVDHCTFKNPNRIARTSCPTAPGSSPGYDDMDYPWTNWYPTVLDSTNLMVYEDCIGVWDNFNNASNTIFTAQDAGGYTVRNCSFTLTFSGSSQQFFDFHGNVGALHTGMRGTYALGIYSNTFACDGTASSIQFAYIRGGSGLIFSNSITGLGAGSAHNNLFEEDASGTFGYTGPPYLDQITNVYIWGNDVNGGSIANNLDANTAAIVGNGVYWSNTPPTPIVLLSYPHPRVTAEDNPNALLQKASLTGNVSLNGNARIGQ